MRRLWTELPLRLASLAVLQLVLLTPLIARLNSPVIVIGCLLQLPVMLLLLATFYQAAKRGQLLIAGFAALLALPCLFGVGVFALLVTTPTLD